MCFSCDDCGYYIANALYVWERLVSCCAMTAIVCCLIATLLIMLGMGVGVGYNYCYVDNKLASMMGVINQIDPADLSYPDTSSTTTTEDDGIIGKKKRSVRSLEIKKSEDFPTSLESPATFTTSSEEIKPTMIIPLRRSDLLSLIAKLVKNNKNVTLELVQ